MATRAAVAVAAMMSVAAATAQGADELDEPEEFEKLLHCRLRSIVSSIGSARMMELGPKGPNLHRANPMRSDITSSLKLVARGARSRRDELGTGPARFKRGLEKKNHPQPFREGAEGCRLARGTPLQPLLEGLAVALPPAPRPRNFALLAVGCMRLRHDPERN